MSIEEELLQTLDKYCHSAGEAAPKTRYLKPRVKAVI
jgi:hypothetical protein